MNHIKRAKRLGRVIEEYYRSYGVVIKVTEVQIIHTLLRYIFTIQIVAGTRVQAIFERAKDVQVALCLPFFYPFQDGIPIRIAVSEYDIQENRLLKILRSPAFIESDKQIPYAIGYDLRGNMCILDLVKLRHLLIAGPTGTGKSIALICIIICTIVSCPVSRVNLIIFDVGANSLSPFENLPHLSHPIIKDTETGIKVLEALVSEMEARLLFNENELEGKPFIVVIVDEFVSMISNINDTKVSQRLINLINNLLRRGRKAKIVMVLATHNPTLEHAKVDLSEVVTRIAFKCARHHNSSTALGIVGAEKLPGEGALLFKSHKGIQFIQGSYVTPKEIEMILGNPPIDYDDNNKYVISESEDMNTQSIVDMVFQRNVPVERDTTELSKIILWALNRETISANQIQKEFNIGNRASSIVDEIYQLGIVSEKYANQPRKVIPRGVEDLSPEVIRILSKNGIPIDTLTAFKEQSDT